MGLDKVVKNISALQEKSLVQLYWCRRQNIKESSQRAKQMEYKVPHASRRLCVRFQQKAFVAEEDPLPDYLLPYLREYIIRPHD